MITLTVNGKKRELDSPTLLPEFLEAQGMTERRIAVGYNGEVVHKDHWGEIVLGDRDVLDVVQMVGGG